METPKGGCSRYVGWFHRLLIMVASGLFGALAFTQLAEIATGDTSDGAVVVAAISGLVLGGSIVIALRQSRCAVVELDKDGVLIVSWWKSRRLAWSDIVGVEVVRGSSAALVPWRVPGFELTDGSLVRVDEIRSLRTPSVVDSVVEDARRRLEERRA